MIQIIELTKCFDSICAVNHISLEIADGEVFGLLGTNGAGKTTLLRLLSGILSPDEGSVSIDGQTDMADPEVKKNIFYLPDSPYYFPNASMEDMVRFYKRQYEDMEYDGVSYMAEQLNLDMRQPLRTFSKGMKRQAFLIFALSARTKYLLCDEVFDGLDPVVTEVMKNLFRQEMKTRQLTVVVAAHKLNDLEDFCQDIAILHQGGVITAGDMKDRASMIHKVQCVLKEDAEEYLKKCLNILRYHREGDFVTLIIRGDSERTKEVIAELKPIFLSKIPMTLEETFIAEMEGTGYDIRKVLQ